MAKSATATDKDRTATIERIRAILPVVYEEGRKLTSDKTSMDWRDFSEMYDLLIGLATEIGCGETGIMADGYVFAPRYGTWHIYKPTDILGEQ